MTTPSLPPVEQIRTLPPFTESEVGEEFIDENGHMNIGDYFRLASWSVWTRLRDLGMGDDYIGERGSSFFTVEHRIGYLGEMRLGQPFSVRAGLVDRTAKTLHGAAYVVDEGRDQVAAWLEAVYVHVSMDTRRASPIPDDLAEAIDAEIEARAAWLRRAATGLTLRR